MRTVLLCRCARIVCLISCPSAPRQQPESVLIAAAFCHHICVSLGALAGGFRYVLVVLRELLLLKEECA